MKNPTQTQFTRASLTTTAAHNVRWFASLLAGTTALGTSALHAANWTGTTDTAWETGTNWSTGLVPANPEDALVNTITPNFAAISGNFSATPKDIKVATGTGTTGRVDHTAGLAATGTGNWFMVGVAGSTANGTYNLANPAGSGGAFTGMGVSSGDLLVGGVTGTSGRLYVGGDDAGADGGTGVANVNTTGTLTIRNDLNVGSQAGTGTFNLDAGTVTTGGWNFFGRSGGTGTFRQSGGTFTNSGRQYVGIDNSLGIMEMTGGNFNNTGIFSLGALNNANATVSTLTISGGTLANTANMCIGGEALDPGSAGKGTLNLSGTGVINAAAEFWVGNNVGSTGIINMTAGTLTVNNWLSIGRRGTGTVNQSGGTITKTGSGSISISNFNSAVGELHVSGGLFDVQSGNLIVGEGGAGTAAFTISGTGEVKAPQLLVAIGGTVVSTVGLNGGTLTTGIINGTGGGTSNVTFNGTKIIATANQAAFITNLESASVGNGGLWIDSQAFTLGSAQNLVAAGTGGLTKDGIGTLLLNGANTYTGTTTVTAGTLGGTGSVASPVVVNSGASLAPGASTGTFTAASATFNAGSNFVVQIDEGQTPDNDLLAVTGNLNISGAALQTSLNGAATALPYTIATFGSRTGTFASVPTGVTVAYNANSITITAIVPQDYDQWIAGFSVGGLIAKTDDFDNDGLTNLEEFGLDGDPSTGAATGKVRSRIETVGADQALVITFPVRMGATFDNVPGPGADATVVADDLLYTIKGSNTLAAFDQGVTEIAVSAAGMPALSDNTKWEYRTFRLNGAVPARGPKGFLSVTVEDAP